MRRLDSSLAKNINLTLSLNQKFNTKSYMQCERNNEIKERMIDIRSNQFDVTIGKYRPLSLEEEIKISILQRQLSEFPNEQYELFSRVIIESGGEVFPYVYGG